jgi:hypothetical protein
MNFALVFGKGEASLVYGRPWQFCIGYCIRKGFGRVGGCRLSVNPNKECIA